MPEGVRTGVRKGRSRRRASQKTGTGAARILRLPVARCAFDALLRAVLTYLLTYFDPAFWRAPFLHPASNYK